MTKPRSPAARLAERFLVGAVESVARAGSKFVESVAQDAARALKQEGEKVEAIGQLAKLWRQTQLPPESSKEKDKPS